MFSSSEKLGTCFSSFPHYWALIKNLILPKVQKGSWQQSLSIDGHGNTRSSDRVISTFLLVNTSFCLLLSIFFTLTSGNFIQTYLLSMSDSPKSFKTAHSMGIERAHLWYFMTHIYSMYTAAQKVIFCVFTSCGNLTAHHDGFP